MQSSAREASIAHKMAECNALLRYFANVSACLLYTSDAADD